MSTIRSMPVGETAFQNAARVSRGSEFVGRSGAFRSIVEAIETVAPRRSSVIIRGETGTGKEKVARQIHDASLRSKQPFVPVDCTALNGNILASQLFGHVKGSFTGAVADTVGFFKAAPRPSGIGGHARRCNQGNADRRACDLCHAPRPQADDP